MRRIVGFGLLLMLLPGCAYYNTFYNARKKYNDAVVLARENPDNPLAIEESLLDDAIYGAGKVLQNHPESRWVDDAQLLLGDAFLLKGRRTLTGSGTSNFQDAMMAYAAVLVMSGDESVLDRARLGMGRAAMLLHRYSDAAAAFREVSDRDRRLHTQSRLLLSEALLEAGQPEMALSILDTLTPRGDDSLRAEYFITLGRTLMEMGMPDSGAVTALRAAEIQSRGNVYYRANIASAEAWVEAGRPEMASAVLNTLLGGYRTDREMAAISLLKGKSDETAGNVSGALQAYLDASQYDRFMETGAEALYLRALLLERQGRVEDALEALAILAARPVIPMWTRLASDRERELSLLGQYRDALAASGSASRWRYRLLAAEKHLDLYGSTPETVLELRTIALEADPMRRAMAMSMLAGLPDTPGDSSRALYEEILALADSSDLAGRVEAILGLPPGPSADFRPGAVIETAWNELEAGRAPEAFNRLERLLSTPWSYETRAEALWVSYLAADASGKEHTVLESRLRELVRYYPETREGVQAALRLNVPVGGFQDDGEEP
jgi:tetratricopeptide (TPR) repeat protein